MVDIRLDQGLTNPSDIRLSDPTVVLFTEGSWHQPLSQPRTQDFTAKAFAVALIASGVTQVMGPVFGSGDVAFASTNTIVPHSRTVLYQSLFSPVPIVALDVAPSKWHKPLAEPTRKPSIIHEQGGAFYVGAPPFSVAENRWFAPLSEPTRRKPTVQPDALSWSGFTPSAAVETVTVDKYYAWLSEPVRVRPGLPVYDQQALISVPQPISGSNDVAFASANTIVPYSRTLLYQSQAYTPFTPAAAETVTVDKWFRPLVEPVRKPSIVYEQGGIFYVGAAPFSEAESRWLSALSEPTRRKPTVQPDGLSWSYFTPASTEVVTVDKYYNWLSEPVRLPRALAAHQQPFLSFVQAEPFAETVSVDRWLQQLSQPTLRPVSVAGQLFFVWSGFTPSPVVRPSVGRVSEGGGQRTRIKPRKAWDRTFSRDTWTEVQSLLKAEQEALDKAVRLDDAKAKAALERATDVASEAIDELTRQAFIDAGQVARLTRALQGAAGATTIKATLRQAQLVNEYAAALMVHMAEMEDEDEAIVLLMM